MVNVSGEATLLLDGVDLENLASCVEGPVVWPYQGFPQRGELPTFPGIDGGLYIRQPYDVAVLPVPVTLATTPCSGGAGTAVRNSVHSLRTACKPDRQIALTRLWDDGSSETSVAKFLNITPTRPLKNVVQCLVEFTLLGLWYGPATAIASAAGAHTILGDTRTYRMTVALPAGATRTVTNTTTGHWFTFTTTVPSGGVTVDVEARTAVGTISGIDYSLYLAWGKDYPLALDPAAGANTLTVSAVSASISYQPAYL